jgi:putative transposase
MPARSPAGWLDHVFIERPWRTAKYEEVYLHAYASVAEAKASLARYFEFCNARRPHTSRARRTPDQIEFQNAAPAQGSSNPQRLHLPNRLRCFNKRGEVSCPERP